MRTIIILLLAAGCAPVAGDDCAPMGGGLCDGAKSLLSCETTGKFMAFECPGPLGCLSRGQGLTGLSTCDFTGAQPGASCPLYAANKAVCSSATLFLRCAPWPGQPRGQVWSGGQCDGGCVTQGDQVFCRP